MSSELKTKILSGVIWQGMERFGSQSFQLMLQIILARILLPSDFGSIVLLSVFIQVAMVFIDSGLGAALVQEKSPSARDFSGVFWVNIPVALLFYAIIYLLSPWIERFYHINGLGLMLRVTALSLFFYALSNVPLAIAQREMAFRKLFLINFPGTLCSGAIGVVMALWGWGAWSLVWMQLSSAFFRMVFSYWLIPWRPGIAIHLSSLLKMLNFSYKLSLSALIDVLFGNLYYLVIGKFFSAAQLGFYSKSCKFPQFAMTGVQGTIGSVIFPALSSCQHDPVKMKEIVRKSIMISSYVMTPLMFGLAGCAKPVILLLLGENWLPAVPFLRLTPLIFVFWPLHVANLQAMVAMGRSDLMLKLELYKKILVIVALTTSVFWGVQAMLIGQVLCSFFAFILNAWPIRKLLGYSVRMQIKDIALIWTCAAVMGVLVFSLEAVITDMWLLIACQIPAGIVIYLGLSWILNREKFRYILNLLQTTFCGVLPFLARFNASSAVNHLK